MKLQELVSNSDLDLTLGQVRAFLLGGLSADRPLSFSKAMEELFESAPQDRSELEPELKKYWSELEGKLLSELNDFFEKRPSNKEFFQTAQEDLDFFLTALSLAGTSSETTDDEVSDLIEELEDTLMDIDEYLAGNETDKESEEELKSLLLDTWKEFVETRQ